MKKELCIIAPDGYEIDSENSTFEKIIFKEIKNQITYVDVVKKLFNSSKSELIYTTDSGYIDSILKYHDDRLTDPNNSTTKEQLVAILTLNKLCNVAKFLNENDNNFHFDRGLNKYYHRISCNGNLFIDESNGTLSSLVYFTSKELAQKAIEILGEDEIKTALKLNF